MKQRLLPIFFCLVSIGLCLLYARFRENLSPWWNQHGGGIPYVMFWISTAFVLAPKRKYIFAICIGCVLFTCLLEFAQLWNPPTLENFRRTRFGAALLGTSFNWNDFSAYFIGGLIGYIVLQSLAAQCGAGAIESNA